MEVHKTLLIYFVGWAENGKTLDQGFKIIQTFRIHFKI